LALECGKHAGLCKRRLTHAGIAKQHWEPIRRAGKRGDYVKISRSRPKK
jgi:hypothetical protein